MHITRADRGLWVHGTVWGVFLRVHEHTRAQHSIDLHLHSFVEVLLRFVRFHESFVFLALYVLY